MGPATAIGVLATAFALATGWRRAAVAPILANVSFGAAIVAYNAFLASAPRAVRRTAAALGPPAPAKRAS